MLDNKNIQKIFSLGDIRKKQLLGEVPQRTRETYREFGYFGGGNLPRSSIVDRIDYSNDTATTSVRGSLTLARRLFSSTGNSNFGYFGGGDFGPNYASTVDRIQYSNDTAQASPRGPLSLNRRGTGSTGNSNFGYFSGGFLFNPTTTDTNFAISTVDRIDYSNDLSIASVRGPLIQRRTNHSSTGNFNFGWIAAGNRATNDPAYYSSIERINYSNDNIVASPRALMPDGTGQGNSATGNNNFGYYHRGVFPDSTYRSDVNRINYSNDLVNVSIRTYLIFSNVGGSATGNSNFGYFGGGLRVPGFTAIEPRICRIDYANDTVIASSRGSLSFARQGLSATSSSSFGGAPNSSFASNFTFPTVPNAGYFGGGSDGTNNLATIDKVDYANDTSTASVRSALSVARRAPAATGNSSFGYFGGGGIPGSVSTTNRLEYSSDTQNTVVRGPLSLSRAFLSATGNSNFGYFVGGGTVGGPYRTTIDRIDYSNDSTTASVRGPLSIVVYNSQAATGNNNFGYFGAGSVPGADSRIHRIDYANDLLNAEVRTSLSSVRFRLAATGNSNFGYFGGGGNPTTSTVDRIDYSNDTQTTSVRGPLSSARGYVAATGNSNFGYFGGGSGPRSTTDRINFSNDTAIASIRGPLSTAKSLLAATSPLAYGGAPIYFTNPLPEVLQKQIEFDDSNTLDLPFKRVLGSYGYFGGGSSTSTVDRINYSNDTATASVRGPLSLQRNNLGATSNFNFGYFGGGVNVNNNSATSIVDRIDYSNDLSTVLVRGSLSVARSSIFGATGNSNFGYFCGGFTPGVAIYSRVCRIDYGNDTQTASIRGPLSSVNYRQGVTGNLNFGYSAGGRTTGPSTSRVDRINYSNDTMKVSIRSPLSLARFGLSATGNQNFGYFGAGAFFPGAVIFSTVDRIDYSNDTSTASVRGPLSAGGYDYASTGNSNFGYFSLGNVSRIDFLNDTETASVRGPLSSGRRFLAATTNARNS
jgi:hypothetical protein